ncbi:hypothetical protein PHSC3_000554 [Chlamydiales bacterium STE3]|nr:hypothetical protein PHSC3_000554 [Chlamydiales bacterium STE3]
MDFIICFLLIHKPYSIFERLYRMWRLLFCSFFWFLSLVSDWDVKHLTLEEKVGQLLLVHFRGETFNAPASKLLSKAFIGGFILQPWANGLHSPEQIERLTKALQLKSRIPLFIAVDQEGGRLNPLKNGFTMLPSQREQAQIPQNIQTLTHQLGQEMRRAGINTNLSPVADIDSNPLNPIIGNRAFSSNPEEVVQCAREALHGYKMAQILCCLKHFPGHGDVSVDSHDELPLIDKTREELKTLELVPFKNLYKEVDLIMTGHLLAPALDPNYPATLSKKILIDLLRSEWGFQGVIISDSLIMRAINKDGSTLKETALQAFNAGCDILSICGRIVQFPSYEPSTDEILEIHHFLVQAVRDGRISENRLDESVQRILNLKRKI